MKTIVIATLAALLAGTTLASAQSQPTYPPAQDYSQPRNDRSCSRSTAFRVPRSKTAARRRPERPIPAASPQRRSIRQVRSVLAIRRPRWRRIIRCAARVRQTLRRNLDDWCRCARIRRSRRTPPCRAAPRTTCDRISRAPFDGLRKCLHLGLQHVEAPDDRRSGPGGAVIGPVGGTSVVGTKRKLCKVALLNFGEPLGAVEREREIRRGCDRAEQQPGRPTLEMQHRTGGIVRRSRECTGDDAAHVPHAAANSIM